MATKSIEIIPATIKPIQLDGTGERPLRVCAYCRVSTDSEEQINSFKSQKVYYTEKINKNPRWVMAGIFADEGLTGTNLKRDEFRRMYRHCKQGRIDLIITKSISRFSRNTLDCLKIVRKLKAMGVGIIFEKEGIETLKMPDETLLIIFSSMAQGESESLSHNIQMGNRQAFAQGKVRFNYNMLGYHRGNDGEPEIVPAEAEVVRRIYSRYLAGHTYSQIAQDLQKDGVPTKKGGAWTFTIIKAVLLNERYTGDAICQKTFVEDPLTHKVKQNNGERDRYMVRDNHPAIITRETYQNAQAEITRRTGIKTTSSKVKNEARIGRYSGKYALTGRLICGDCGNVYRRVTWRRGKVVWRCLNRLEGKAERCKHSPTLDEEDIHNTLLSAFNRKADKKELLRVLGDGLTGDGSENSLASLRLRKDELWNERSRLSLKMAEQGPDDSTYDDRFYQVVEELRQLESRIAEAEALEVQREGYGLGADMRELLAQRCEGPLFTEYSEDLVRQMVQFVRVESAQRLVIEYMDNTIEEVAIATGNVG